MVEQSLPRIALISDLWGKQKADWVGIYKDFLSPYFQIDFLDACELGGINLSKYDQESLHTQFVDGGIDRATQALLDSKQHYELLLGISMGGVIGWQAACKGLKINALFAISSTRLRKEVIKPECPVHLYFGGNDPHQPQSAWYKKMNISAKLLENQPHELYRAESMSQLISSDIIQTYAVKEP